MVWTRTGGLRLFISGTYAERAVPQSIEREFIWISFRKIPFGDLLLVLWLVESKITYHNGRQTRAVAVRVELKVKKATRKKKSLPLIRFLIWHRCVRVLRRSASKQGIHRTWIPQNNADQHHCTAGLAGFPTVQSHQPWRPIGEYTSSKVLYLCYSTNKEYISCQWK